MNLVRLRRFTDDVHATEDGAYTVVRTGPAAWSVWAAGGAQVRVAAGAELAQARRHLTEYLTDVAAGRSARAGAYGLAADGTPAHAERPPAAPPEEAAAPKRRGSGRAKARPAGRTRA